MLLSGTVQQTISTIQVQRQSLSARSLMHSPVWAPPSTPAILVHVGAAAQSAKEMAEVE